MKRVLQRLSIPTIMLLGASLVQANTIKEVVEHTMSNNPKIISTLKNNEAYRLYIDEAEGGYYPTLDLTAYVGTEKEKLNPDNSSSTKNSTKGYNAQLDLEQLIYDGGLTNGAIDEAQYRYNSNKFLNQSIVDGIIYSSIDSYLNLVKYNSRVDISKQSLSIYGDYLTTAKETEEISGEALQKAQVNAKIHYANNTLYQEMNSSLTAKSSFKKNVGMESDGKSCRPNLDNSMIPASQKELVDQVILKNPLILEQIENIKEQRAILNQQDASFYPTIKFKAQAVYDKDLIDEDVKTQTYSAKIELAYNIFNGNKDKTSSIREKVFLDEAQKTLDTVTSDVVDTATTAYNTYKYSAKRVGELKAYIQDNENILSIYKDQFEGGTRTFIDVLNIERDLVSAKKDLVDAQYDLDSSYYEITNSLGQIKESVLNTNNDVCTEAKPLEKKSVEKMETTSDELQEMLANSADAYPEKISGTYALYIVAYKNTLLAEKSLEKAKTIIGDSVNAKIESTRGFNSVVIYNVSSKDEIKTIQSKLDADFPGSYIRKFVK